MTGAIIGSVKATIEVSLPLFECVGNSVLHMSACLISTWSVIGTDSKASCAKKRWNRWNLKLVRLVKDFKAISGLHPVQ